MNFEEIVNQLKKCKIQGGIWIDAGCGNGTYTIPLSTLVSEVIALDKNKNNLSYLESKMTSKMNIRTQHFDFSKPSWYSSVVDGILFGFSLHYDPEHRIALEHAYQQLKPGGKLEIHVPDLDKVIRMYISTIDEKFLKEIYGNQEHELDFYQTGWTFQTLERLVSKVNFVRLYQVDKPKHRPFALSITIYKPK